MHGNAPPDLRTGPRESVEESGGRLPAIVAVLCIAFLAFVAGSYSMYSRIFPADSLRGAFQGGAAYYERLTGYNEPEETDFWKPARTGVRGVLRHDAARAQEGLTLY